ncbi:MAG: hypothetical protein DI623_03095 [Sphingomonas sanxanigenens]|uniref:Uncharacterized protein n=1 Tax=Sphingomonas sanxanigenens TaxID=397260 RepID=A0A2W5ADZ0_9SPHN|nr:MAG: hypothetical protein DI623_03095 [Sphingomonas sanxanigenens]
MAARYARVKGCIVVRRRGALVAKGQSAARRRIGRAIDQGRRSCRIGYECERRAKIEADGRHARIPSDEGCRAGESRDAAGEGTAQPRRPGAVDNDGGERRRAAREDQLGRIVLTRDSVGQRQAADRHRRRRWGWRWRRRRCGRRRHARISGRRRDRDQRCAAPAHQRATVASTSARWAPCATGAADVPLRIFR